MTVKFNEAGARGLLLNNLVLDSELDLLLESKPTKREKEEKIKKRHQEKIKKSEKKFEFYSSDLTYLIKGNYFFIYSKKQIV